jgi:hypothetical protein
MSNNGFYRCPECGDVEVNRRTRCRCGYAISALGRSSEGAKARGSSSNTKKPPRLWVALLLCLIGIIGVLNLVLPKDEGPARSQGRPYDQDFLIRCALTFSFLLIGIVLLVQRFIRSRSK